MLTVLIADDEMIERNYLNKIISMSNRYEVIGDACNGIEVLQICNQIEPDIVIMDIKMPLYNGLQSTKQLKKKFPNMIIILNSAYAEFKFAQEAIEYGVDAYLVKPSSEEEILSTIESCVQKRSKTAANFNLSTKEIDTKKVYPYELVSNYLEAIEIYDLKDIRNCQQRLIEFFKSLGVGIKGYRLYLINLIFSVEQSLVSSNSNENLVRLLSSENYILQMTNAVDENEIISTIENFFDKLVQLLALQGGIQNGDTVQMITKYIDTHYRENIELEDLANIVFLSPSYLSRVFHDSTGISIRGYINKKRIEHAKYLLETSSLPIKVIVEECGFINTSYFYRLFKQLTGNTPANYRKGIENK